jgi:hypothetical protein
MIRDAMRRAGDRTLARTSALRQRSRRDDSAAPDDRGPRRVRQDTPTFEKPGAAAADVQRDTNECLTNAMASEGGSILTPRMDHDLLVTCMEARGYRVGST